MVGTRTNRYHQDVATTLCEDQHRSTQWITISLAFISLVISLPHTEGEQRGR